MAIHPPVDADVALEVACHEALVRQAYRDSVGKLTWCVGMTNATGHLVERYIGNPAPLQHCMNVYAWALKNYAAGVYAAFKGKRLTKAQFAAALSFHWNTGAIGRATWVKLWKAGKTEEAREAFMNWVTPPEIEGRREKERDLFFDGVWSNDGTMTEYAEVRKGSLQPVWGSGITIDVAAELRAAFADAPAVIEDQAPQPDAPVEQPTLTPVKEALETPMPPIVPNHPATPEIGESGYPIYYPKPGEIIRPKPSPMDQISKVIGSTKGTLKGNTMTAAVMTLLVAAGWLPEPLQTPEALVAMSVLLNTAATTLWGAFDTYMAPRNAE